MNKLDLIRGKPVHRHIDERGVRTDLDPKHGRRLDVDNFKHATRIKCPKCRMQLLQNPLNRIQPLYCICGWKGRVMTQWDMDNAKTMKPRIDVDKIYNKLIK